MICPKCGKELPDGIVFCTFCGAKLTQDAPQNTVEAPESAAPEAYAAPDSCAYAAPAPEYTQFDVLKAKVSSPLFLAICIVMTVLASVSVISLSFNLFAILGTIACWMAYANAKSATEPLKQSSYKFAAVITRIAFVLNWVLVGLLSLLELFMVVFISFSSSFFSNEEVLNGLYDSLYDLEQEFPGMLSELPVGNIAYFLTTGLFILFSVVLVLTIAWVIVYNVCYIRHIDKYTHSLSNAFVTGEFTFYNKSLATRFLVFGIIEAVIAVPATIVCLTFAPFVGIASACAIALPFLFYALINSAKNTVR